MLKRNPSRGLTTSLFTDIVGSTAMAAELGDQRWHSLQGQHHAIVRRELKRFGGHEVDTAGDGFFATFGAPADGVRCAAAIGVAVRDIGLEIRAGLHTGETELTGEKVAGIAVNTAARVSALAGPGEVLVTRTLAELVAGSGFTFSDRGDHALKGIPGEWRLLALSGIDGEPIAATLEPGEASQRRARVADAALPQRGRRTLVLVATVAVIALIAATLPFILHHKKAAGPALAANGIQLIDATSGQRTGSVPLPGAPGGLTSGAGSVWVSDTQDGTVVKVDPSTRAAVDTIQVGADPSGIAFGDGAVWVALTGAGELARIDPTTDTVVSHVIVGNGPTGVGVSPGFVWVTNYTDDTVVRVDTTTNEVVPDSRVDVGNEPVAVAANADGAWVANAGDGTVTRIPLGAQGTTAIPVGNGPAGISIGPSGVWVTNSADGTLSQIDANTGVELQRTPVGDGPTGVTVDASTVWVADHFGGAIARIDAATAGKAGAPIPMVAAPVAMALVQGELWVAASAPRSLHKGGTLKFASDAAPDSIDPAVAYLGIDWQILGMTNDGLVGVDRVGGPQGGAIVPDLAVSVPTPSDGGRTYTFQVRPGVRYSDGSSVAPEDFRLGIERMLLIHSRGLPTYYYTGIVGAKACTSAATCDLTKGIVVSDVSRTVTFHLTAPDPEFLYKLALPFADAVPPGTSMTPIRTTPMPATGPYMIKAYTPGPKGSIELVRNPYFVEWSQAAQPAGYPDQIEGSYGVTTTQQVSAVEQGKLDAMDESPPGDLLSQLDTKYPSQLHEAVLSQTAGFALNTQIPPFNDVRVRRALNDAVDRDEMVRLSGGPQLVHVSCQTLPPDFPGYQPYCPYTLHPSPSGAWTAPDLKQAQRLVAASGTRGIKITVWSIREADAPLYASQGAYVVKVLNGLGYHAQQHILPLGSFFKQLQDPRIGATVQIGFYAWGTDYPAASGMLVPLFDCASVSVGTNTSRFCDQGVQAQMKSALAKETSDPAAAGDAWAHVDRSVVDQAPWLTLPTPLQVTFVSTRTGNVQLNPQWGLLLSQMWVN